MNQVRVYHNMHLAQALAHAYKAQPENPTLVCEECTEVFTAACEYPPAGTCARFSGAFAAFKSFGAMTSLEHGPKVEGDADAEAKPKSMFYEHEAEILAGACARCVQLPAKR